MTQDDLISIFCLPAARKKPCVSKQSDINFPIYVPFLAAKRNIRSNIIIILSLISDLFEKLGILHSLTLPICSVPLTYNLIDLNVAHAI